VAHPSIFDQLSSVIRSWVIGFLVGIVAGALAFGAIVGIALAVDEGW
jgi:mannose/fructose/N-acetylgalactosamine-specific phosphotransferase system component IIC